MSKGFSTCLIVYLGVSAFVFVYISDLGDCAHLTPPPPHNVGDVEADEERDQRQQRFQLSMDVLEQFFCRVTTNFVLFLCNSVSGVASAFSEVHVMHQLCINALHMVWSERGGAEEGDVELVGQLDQVVGEEEDDGGAAEVLDGGTDLEMVEAPADEPGTRAKGSVSFPPLAQNLCNPGNSRQTENLRGISITPVLLFLLPFEIEIRHMKDLINLVDLFALPDRQRL